jgi:zinc transport system permease protein
MSLGIILISKTPGYVDINSYLFGNILLVSSNDISLIIGTSLVIITTIILFYNKLMITCFDEEYARIKGINTKFYYILLLILVALTVVIMVRLVGIVLVVAMLTLPPAIASNFSKRLRTMMFLSVFVGIVSVFSGIAISYSPDLPSGATIVLLTAAIYLTILSVRTLVNKLRKFLEQS